MDFSKNQQQNPLQGDPSDSQFYNAPQNPKPYTSPCDYYPSNPNPNPNPNPSNPHPQQESPGPGTGLPPPGADLCARVPYTPAAVTYGRPQQLMQPEAAAAHFDDPSAQQQSLGADSVVHAATIVPSNGMEQIVGVNPDSMVWNNQMIPPYTSSISMNWNLKKTTVVESAWCELCKVDCNSQEVFNTHKLGKKHMKNLKKLEESKNVAAKEPVATTVTEEPARKPEENLETKRQKLVEHGTAVDALRVCTLCNVVCNSETVFNMHLVGQKHAAKVASASDEMQPMVGPIPDPIICTDQVSQPSSVDDTPIKMNKKKTEVQRLWCEICIVDCSSQEDLDNHKLGKRHKRNLEKMEELRNAAPAVKPDSSDAGTNGSQPVLETKTTGGKAKRKKAASTEEELEMKKRKLLECGTTDSVKVCTICNIVCNSETAFSFHLTGKKHATQMKKQAPEIAKSAFGPKPDSDATVTTTVEPQLVSAATATSTVNPRPATAATATPTDGALLASVETAAPTVGTELVTAATSAPTATAS